MITKNEDSPALAKALDLPSLVLKREDMHPYGSHKGRSIPIMIDIYMKEGFKHFAVSSSGNAALAAALYIKELNKSREDKIKIDILVGRHISTKKLQKLEYFKDEYINVTIHDRPLQTLHTIIKDTQIAPLRQSTDDKALIGYSSLAKELLEIKDLQAVFIGTSSGTTAQALTEYFSSNEKKISVNIVQTSSCHPIADSFVNDTVIDEESIADAIVDHTALRKEKLSKMMKESSGNGWIVSNEQISTAQELVKKHTGLSISTNSALSIAGLMQAVYTGDNWEGTVACIICGD